jgi:hypothetical protein
MIESALFIELYCGISLKQLLLGVFVRIGNSCLLSLCHFCIVYSVRYYVVKILKLHHQMHCSVFNLLFLPSLIKEVIVEAKR